RRRPSSFLSDPRAERGHERAEAREAGADHLRRIHRDRRARGKPEDEEAHRDAMVAMSSYGRAAGTGAVAAVDHQGVPPAGVADQPGRDAAAPEPGYDRREPVAFLDPKLAKAVQHGLAGCMGGSDGKDRIFVDHPWHPLGI